MAENNQTPKTPAIDSLLWQALDKFTIDEPGAEFTFVQRLADENRWPLHFAERVLGEYKRFLYLAVAAEHPASPSDAVDQVWHLHLAYTRSYWNELCGKVLQRPLHHLPTQGGRIEDEKHSDLYRRTLESYERCFGHPAPADIWPTKAMQAPEKFARIRTSDFWMLRKPSRAFRNNLLAFVALILFSGTTAACTSSGIALPIFGVLAVVVVLLIAFRKRLGGGEGSCSGGSGCSSGFGFFSFFSSCSSDSDNSDSGGSDSGGDSSCSSSSCSSCSSSD